MSNTDNKPCIVCEPPIGPRTTQKVIELAQLCLRLAVIACAFAERINTEGQRFPSHYDVGRVAQFAIVHDLVEAYAGDTNTLASTGDTAKEAREAAALARIRDEFASVFPWLTDTIDEYESLVSPEARFVKALDKVLPKITHLLNGGATLRQHGVDASNIDAVNGSQVAKMRATYAADQPTVMALYADVHARLREALAKQSAQSVSDATNEREATDERVDAHGGVLGYIGSYAVFDAELTSDRTRLFLVERGKDFDFDTWEAMCEAAMAGEHAPSALENEIALHARTRDALIAVRKERDALLVDTCHGASCGKCLHCRTKQPAHEP